MKRIKILCFLLLIIFNGAFLNPNYSEANLRYWNCDIVEIRTYDNGRLGVFLLPDGKTNKKLFYIPIGEENRMLSILLTALSLDKQVTVKMDFTIKETDVVELSIKN